MISKWAFQGSLIVFGLLCISGMSKAQSDCASKIEESYLQNEYEECLEIASSCSWGDSLEMLPMLGHSAYEIKNYPLAKDYLNRAIELGDSSLLSLQTLSRIYEQEWNFPKAIKYARLYLELDSANSEEWYRLGLTALKAELMREAFHSLAKTLSLNPTHFQARVKLSDIMIQQNEPEDAFQIVKEGLVIDSTNVLLLLQAGRTSYFRDSFDQAVTYYGAAEESIDLPLKHSRMKGIAYYRLDSFEKAIHYLSDALVGTDKDYMHYFMAMSHLGLEEKEEAADHFDMALEESYGKRIAMYCDYRANIYEEEGSWEEAIQLYEEALRRSEDAKFLIRLALVYDKMYDDKRFAIRYLKKYLETKDEDYRSFAKKRIQVLKSYEHMKSVQQ